MIGFLGRSGGRALALAGAAAVLALTTAGPATADDGMPAPGTCNTDLLLPYAGHPDKFIQCSNGTPYVMPCPPDTEFSYREQLCDWPSNTGSTEAVPVEVPAID